ncbi:sulfite exporter TauE/SafE family protein [filamentous cyanobacterium LEGE 11480]|uniref:Sulfite exporter TauE/SafE family protein n=1 Tax=Romeriopsis navalis LEGE 11480 TaxID=2777977 RepID=A0A928VM36_9CYAN|nr:sulfite exporter TauE/SafE family protein [Romeriopsis navalis]MBE9029156.1 sulfite exporter TauE/SafE family protein [Romeriopsis navalis LEGE 11480]
MTDLLLIATLGFLGSFGHCLGMCGPLTVAFSLSNPGQSPTETSWPAKLRFNLLLNLGRILSYGLVGLCIGTIGSVLIAGGQLAGIGSGLRQGLAIVTGLLLIWFGLHQIQPTWLPKLPLLHPTLGKLHDRLNHLMFRLANISPIFLGLLWGLMPCGFLYAAQIKAAETGNPQLGAVTMMAFGIGTLPMMLGVGSSTTFLSRDRRSQLFRLGGWVTLAIGILTLTRNSDMVDYTGHSALGLLALTLIARPIAKLWSGPLQYRRALGVGAFILSIAHIAHTVSHTFEWNFTAWQFLLPSQQWGFLSGVMATVLLTPPAFTSFDQMVKALGNHWRTLHLLSIPAFLLVAVHALLLGSSYLGALTLSPNHWGRVVGLGLIVIGVMATRSRYSWKLVGQEKRYVKAKQSLIYQQRDRQPPCCND